MKVSIPTDGSLKEKKVGCAVVLPTATLKYQLLPQTKIFNAEMFAILKATEHSKHMHRKTIIMTDSLRSLTALERVYLGRNPTIPKILNLLGEEGEDLKLMWVTNLQLRRLKKHYMRNQHQKLKQLKMLPLILREFSEYRHQRTQHEIDQGILNKPR
jgi:hypothetical protein